MPTEQVSGMEKQPRDNMFRHRLDLLYDFKTQIHKTNTLS